jgi:hypothetical protein
MEAARDRSPLRLEAGKLRRRRPAIDRHVDEGRDPTSRRGPRCGLDVLPVGVAGVAQVDVAVDEARQEDLVGREFKCASRPLKPGAEGFDCLNPPVANADLDGALAAVDDRPTRPDDEVEPRVCGSPRRRIRSSVGRGPPALGG